MDKYQIVLFVQLGIFKTLYKEKGRPFQLKTLPLLAESLLDTTTCHEVWPLPLSTAPSLLASLLVTSLLAVIYPPVSKTTEMVK